MSTSLIAPPLLNPQTSASGVPFNSSTAPIPVSPGPSGTNRGICSLNFQNRIFRFRTNPNEIWWSYELLKAVDDTYGGRVIQLLGTKLGDLKVQVEIGAGGWPYLMQVVLYLRDLLSDQRKGNTATFEYTTRNWKLNVYAMSIPFEDRMEATVRPIELNFKIQEDLTGVVSQVSLNAELSRLQDGVYGPLQTPHNQYNDYNSIQSQVGQILSGNADPVSPGGPAYSPSGITNTVDSSPMGSDPLAAQGLIPFLPSIPGLSSLGIPGLGG